MAEKQKPKPKAEVKPAETFKNEASFEYLHSEEGKFSVMEFHVYSNNKIPESLQEVLENPQDYRIMLVGKDGKEAEVTDFVAQNYAGMNGIEKVRKKGAEPESESKGFGPKFKTGEAAPGGKPGKFNLINPKEKPTNKIDEKNPYAGKEPEFKGTGKEKPAEGKPGKFNLINPKEKPAKEKGESTKTEEKAAEEELAKSKKKKKGGIDEKNPYGQG